MRRDFALLKSFIFAIFITIALASLLNEVHVEANLSQPFEQTQTTTTIYIDGGTQTDIIYFLNSTIFTPSAYVKIVPDKSIYTTGETIGLAGECTQTLPMWITSTWQGLPASLEIREPLGSTVYSTEIEVMRAGEQQTTAFTRVYAIPTTAATGEYVIEAHMTPGWGGRYFIIEQKVLINDTTTHYYVPLNLTETGTTTYATTIMWEVSGTATPPCQWIGVHTRTTLTVSGPTTMTFPKIPMWQCSGTTTSTAGTITETKSWFVATYSTMITVIDEFPTTPIILAITLIFGLLIFRKLRN